MRRNEQAQPNRSEAPRAAARSRVAGFLQLFGSGAIGALGLSLLASNRWRLLPSADVARLLLFIQWETLGLTIAKCGLDTVVFAVVSHDASIRFGIGRTVVRRVLPLALVVGAAGTGWFGLEAALALTLAMVSDAYATMAMADLNAHGRFGTSASSNLLNYPLFFALLAASASLRPLDVSFAEWAFAASSVARAAALWTARSRWRSRGQMMPAAQGAVAVQQALNYTLFRSDQLLLALPLAASLASVTPSYLYLAKLPELAAGLLTIAGTVLFPALFDRGSERPRLVAWLQDGALKLALLATAILMVLGAGALWLFLWRGAGRIPALLAMPFLAHVALILPANALTYWLLSRGYVRALLRAQVVGAAIGLPVALVALTAGNAPILALSVPLQLAIFTAAALFAPTGERSALYSGTAS